MGLTGLKKFFFGREVASTAKEAEMGKFGDAGKTAWRILDGWKTWLVALVAVYKLACHACATSGYLDAGVGALGWNSVTAAFDPAQAFAAAAVILALGHHFVKGVQQYRAGVPLDHVHSPDVALVPDNRTGAMKVVPLGKA